MDTPVERIAAHIVFFGIFLTAILNLAVFEYVPLTRFDLPMIYVGYVALVAIIQLALGRPFQRIYIFAGVILPLVLFIYTDLLSYISNLTFDAAAINLVAAAVAFIFIFSLSRKLEFSTPWSILLALMAVVSPVAIEESLSFVSIAFIYEISLVAVAALVALVMKRDKGASLSVFIGSWILLVGAQDTNPYVCVALLVICLVILSQSYRGTWKVLERIAGIILIAVLVTILLVFKPFGINFSGYYPSSASTEYEITGQTPLNLYNDGKLARLFYGIYSEQQAPTDYLSINNVISLKIPFSVDEKEISNMATFQPSIRAAMGGVLFSGLFTASLIFLFFAFIFDPVLRDERIVGIAALFILTAIACALALPSPNVLAYTPEITAIPVFALACLLLISRTKASRWLKVAMPVFALLILLNSAISIDALVNAMNASSDNANNFASFPSNVTI